MNWRTKITPNKNTGKIDIEVRDPFTKKTLKDSSLNQPISSCNEFKIRQIVSKLREELEKNESNSVQR